MRPDPRCPHCNEKVSATASWCMHCGQDFEQPVDAGDTGLASALESGDSDDLVVYVRDGEYGPKAAAVAVAAVGLFTLSWVAPPSTTFLNLVAALGIGYVAAKRATFADAVDRGAQLLALAPFVLWLFAAVQGFPVGIGSLTGPVVYAAVVLFAARRVRTRLER